MLRSKTGIKREKKKYRITHCSRDFQKKKSVKGGPCLDYSAPALMLDLLLFD